MIKTGLRQFGIMSLKHYNAAGELLKEITFPNGLVDVGANHLWETEFRSGSQVASWYLALIDNSGYTALSNSDTMSSHAGWSELVTYSEATRPQWSPGAASSRQVVNGTTVDFSINGTCVIKGVFLTTDNTKSGTSGTLWATALLDTVINAGSGDTIKLTYTVGAAA